MILHYFSADTAVKFLQTNTTHQHKKYKNTFLQALRESPNKYIHRHTYTYTSLKSNRGNVLLKQKIKRLHIFYTNFMFHKNIHFYHISVYIFISEISSRSDYCSHYAIYVVNTSISCLLDTEIVPFVFKRLMHTYYYAPIFCNSNRNSSLSLSSSFHS